MLTLPILVNNQKIFFLQPIPKIILSYNFYLLSVFFFTIFLQIQRLVHEEGHVAIPCLHTWKPGTRSQKGPKSWGRRGPTMAGFQQLRPKIMIFFFLSSQAIKIWFNTLFWLVIMVKNQCLGPTKSSLIFQRYQRTQWLKSLF